LTSRDKQPQSSRKHRLKECNITLKTSKTGCEEKGRDGRKQPECQFESIVIAQLETCRVLLAMPSLGKPGEIAHSSRVLPPGGGGSIQGLLP
jgi:hypothetical protein